MTGIIAALNHITIYRYSRPVTLGMQTIRLRPAPHTHSPVQSYSLTVTPKEHFINWQQDPFGNYLARVVFPEKVSEFRVEVDLVAEIRVFNPFDFFLEDYAKDFPFQYESGLKEELSPYLEIKESGPALMALLAKVDKNKRGMVDFLVGLNQQVNAELGYVVRLEPGVQSCEETLGLKSGSCRDMAWLLCQMLRHLGFAARFASGYLIQLKPDVKPLEGPAGTDKDFTDLHAWAEVYLPGAGWIGLDPTSGLFTGEGHIPLCCTPSPSSAAPVSGTIEPCESELIHEMSVTRIVETPRVTKPFSDVQWDGIDALGKKVDADLQGRDVHLTMGGEPTFVSVEDPNGEEWHFTALSAVKKKLGHALLLKLKEHFAKGGLLHFGQGKWYPGEVLPRWAMTCVWRKDTQALWGDASLFDAPDGEGELSIKEAKGFALDIAQSLGIASSYVLSAYDGKELSGYVLPLAFSYTRKGWVSNKWPDKLALIRGDSPLGLRLPLSELPHVKEGAKEFWPVRKASEQKQALPAHPVTRGNDKIVDFAKDPVGLIRTALCTQVRGGVLYVFLPPISYIEHFLELLGVIESVAQKRKVKLVLEGYPPPGDVRLDSFSITPDPGVIEVNVQPAKDWAELKAIATAVYAEAHQCRLTPEKFLLDGRRVGTGGGNHIVIGAAIAEESPFLRRPDLLRSMVAFWQNHPSLSYLFSSMYIGPTSQSPRIDEARLDSLYELEIAFAQMEEKDEVDPARVDGLFRNLLVDLTGNTHRAEFCIDKLYNPLGSRGRLGLLEMRGFEMTPHPQMNLLQGLLIRACIAHFWKTPYRQKLVRWGTQLHDRFMLPYYVAEDFRDVLHELNTGGYAFEADWFDSFFTFRFPHYGKVTAGPLTLELQMALEPWPVMGEEINAGNVSRSVDSSVERLQVSVRGVNDKRYVVTCNGRRVPLQATQEAGVRVGAVRYKAWAPPSALHPDMKVHTPLVFDVVDVAAGRSLGGCRYHVMHPGGRNYETIPVNENEAEGRMLSRFEPMGHTPAAIATPPAENNPDFPHTLDLRYKPG